MEGARASISCLLTSSFACATTEQLDEYEDERKDEDSLQSQIAQLENLNQTLKIEFQEMVEEKSKLAMELAEAKNERDACKNQLGTVDEQV